MLRNVGCAQMEGAKKTASVVVFNTDEIETLNEDGIGSDDADRLIANQSRLLSESCPNQDVSNAWFFGAGGPGPLH